MDTSFSRKIYKKKQKAISNATLNFNTTKTKKPKKTTKKRVSDVGNPIKKRKKKKAQVDLSKIGTKKKKKGGTRKKSKVEAIRSRMKVVKKNDLSKTEKRAIMETIANDINQLKVTKGPKSSTNKREKILKLGQELLNHPRNECIELVGDKAFSITLPGRKSVFFCGLHPTLRKALWPQTEEDPFKRDKEDLKRRQVKKVYEPSHKKSKVEYECKFHGKEHGIQVHKEVQLFCENAIRRRDMNDCFREIKNADPCTLRIINCFKEKGWVPFASEFKMWCEEMAVATAADVIMIDTKTDTFVLVELKTGYDGECYGPHPSDEYLDPPFQTLKNCPETRHHLQLLMQKIILKKKYNKNMTQCYVVRTSPKDGGVYTDKLIKWGNSKINQDNLYNHLVLYQNKH